MNKIVCIGSASKDIFFPTKEGVIIETPQEITSKRKIAFETGAKYHIDNRFESLGGCAVNVACGLQRLGIPVSGYSALGSDLIGDWIRQEIKNEGIDDSLLATENCLSGLSAIVVDENIGERIIFSNQESNERLQVDPEKIKPFEWISVTDPSGDWKSVLKTVIEVAFSSGAKIVFNPRGKNIKEDAKAVSEFSGKMEIFFVNKDEATEILVATNPDLSATELDSEEFLVKELKKFGARVVVVTDGERGAWAFDGSEVVHEEADKVQAVDTTGAGDAFSSGFLAAHMKERTLKACVQWGIKNSASVVQHYGGVEGLLRENEIEK